MSKRVKEKSIEALIKEKEGRLSELKLFINNQVSANGYLPIEMMEEYNDILRSLKTYQNFSSPS